MQTRDISPEQWQSFFNEFTQLHQGEHVNVETIGNGELGVKSRLCDLPLAAIVCVPPQSRKEDDKWIEVIATEPSKSHASYSVAEPSKVRIAEESGHIIALQIESANGSITMVRFEPSRENMPEGFTVS